MSAAGCGNDDGSWEESDLVSITVTPGDSTLVITNAVPAVADFKATGTFADGSTADITADVLFSIDDPRLGSFDGATLTTTAAHGGRSRVSAHAGNILGTASLTVRIQQDYRDPGAGGDLPEDAGAVFDGPADPERAPSLVYPNANVLLPPNLRALEFHFYPGPDNDLFEIAYTSDTTDVKVYTRCTEPMNGGCIYTPDDVVWTWIAQSNRGATPLTVRMRATDDTGSGVGASDPLSISFSQDDIQGAIYYWTTSDTGDSSTAIMRFDFGSTTQTVADKFIGTEMTEGNCVGCHSLSRAGDKMITASNGSYDAFVLLLDVGQRQALVPFDSTARSAFSSWNPSGTRYVGVFADERKNGFVSYDLNVFDGNTGALVEVIDVGGTEENPSTHPDWSPEGERIAYTHIGYTTAARRQSGTIAFADQASLRMVTREGDRWSEPVSLTSSVEGQGTFYPAFSPAGDVLVFNQSVCANGSNGAACDAYDDPGAALHAMIPEPGATSVELAAANKPGLTDELTTVQASYPKWAPFTFQRSSEFGSRLHWLTFSSNRNYGLREPPPAHTLVWMVGVDPDAVLAGRDPAFAAFALPFQDLTTSNHTAQWAERAIIVD